MKCLVCGQTNQMRTRFISDHSSKIGRLQDFRLLLRQCFLFSSEIIMHCHSENLEEFDGAQ